MMNYCERCEVLNIRQGEIVKVRDEQEILQTLDKNGTLEGLPFILEMRAYCGREFIVLKRVSKILVEGHGTMKQLRNTVILAGAICNGEAHAGCQRFCPLLWKEAWLVRPQDKSK